jgi:hypothetical protein
MFVRDRDALTESFQREEDRLETPAPSAYAGGRTSRSSPILSAARAAVMSSPARVPLREWFGDLREQRLKVRQLTDDVGGSA